MKNFFENIFSVKNDNKYITIKILFITINFRYKKDIMSDYLYFRGGGEYKLFIKKFLEELNKIDLREKYTKLIKNLDEDSIKTVNAIIGAMQKVDGAKKDYVEIFDENEVKLIYSNRKNMVKNICKIDEECWAYNKYLLCENHFELCVFQDKHSIDTLNTDYFKNKDIIDAGAFIGDSAVILSDYTQKKVYSFEPVKLNYEKLLKTIGLNKKQNIIPLNFGLGDKEEDIELYVDDSSSGFMTDKPNRQKQKCKITTLDKFVEENKLNVGLIKTDLEGFEQNFLKGAINTIKTQRPSMLISIYHTCSDFFDIKPLIESLCLGYNFRIVKPRDGQILLETLLICEPKEIT